MLDATLRDNVFKELQFEPSVHAGQIGVAVMDGIVTLSGHVASYAEKTTAVSAVRRVTGVHAIADEIEVRCLPVKTIPDDEIARRGLEILRWDITLPQDAIQITVSSGRVTLTGTVEWQYQRKAAEDDIRKLAGVRSFNNAITLAPQATSENVKAKIEDALVRNAETDAQAIRVVVDEGHHVRLEGKVRTWNERVAAETAAWSAPGVNSVDDRLAIDHI